MCFKSSQEGRQVDVLSQVGKGWKVDGCRLFLWQRVSANVRAGIGPPLCCGFG